MDEFRKSNSYHINRELVINRLVEIIENYVNDSKIPHIPIINFSINIEKSCYNKTFNIGTLNNIKKQWEDDKFLEIYNRETYRIISYIDNEKTGIIILNKIINDELNAFNLSNYEMEHLNPIMSNEFKEMYDKTIIPKHIIKFSTLYKCNKCNKSQTQLYSVQTRSLDEGASLFATCINCNLRWQIS